VKPYLVTALLVLILKPATLAQNEVPPRRYPLKHPISASVALQSYKETMQKIGTFLAPASQQDNSSIKDVSFECPGIDGSPRRCVDVNERRYYLGVYLPYASNVPAVVPTSEPMIGGAATTGWIPPDKISEGPALLEKLIKLSEVAQKKPLFDCNEEAGECKTLVEAIPAGKDERALAVCDVAHVGEVVGGVRNCVAVAILTPAASYLRAVIAYTPGQKASAPRDESDVVAEFHFQKGSDNSNLPTVEAALRAVQGELSSSILDLKTVLLPKVNPVWAVGVTGLRRSSSPVLGKGTWEEVSVRATVEKEEGASEGLKVKAFISMQLNMVGRDDPEDFHPPSEADRSVYRNQYEGLMRLRLSRLCGTRTWRDLSTIICHASANRTSQPVPDRQ
jgi:hypothetical protein